MNRTGRSVEAVASMLGRKRIHTYTAIVLAPTPSALEAYASTVEAYDPMGTKRAHAYMAVIVPAPRRITPAAMEAI